MSFGSHSLMTRVSHTTGELVCESRGMRLSLMNIIHTAGNVPESHQSQSKHGIVHRANISQESFYINVFLRKMNA